MIKFHLTDLEEKRYKEFVKKHDRLLAEKQKVEFANHFDYEYLTRQTNNWTEPYLGTSGGAYSITFHPNSICRGVTVTADLLDISEDITDYSVW